MSFYLTYLIFLGSSIPILMTSSTVCNQQLEIEKCNADHWILMETTELEVFISQLVDMIAMKLHALQSSETMEDAYTTYPELSNLRWRPHKTCGGVLSIDSDINFLHEQGDSLLKS